MEKILDEYIKNILDEYIKTTEFRDFVLSEAISASKYYTEPDFYFYLEQQLLSVLDENGITIDNKVIEKVYEFIISKDCFIEYIPEEIIEIWSNE